jgi:uncharacterized protein (TIGR00661 family)
MKFLFIVQGEGRGHMTQAISLSDMLRSEGHEIVAVIVGKSKRREIPDFFFKKINSNVTAIESPNFLVDAKNKKIKIGPTLVYNGLKLGTFIKSLRVINKIVKETKPDVIINFYDLLAGIYTLFYKPKAKYVCIGHQYLLSHPKFVFPKGFKVDKFLFDINTGVTSSRAHKMLALSFKEMSDMPEKKIYVVPPLLRPEVTRLVPEQQNYILGYMLNSGYAEDIESWHRAHPEIEMHFFWDKKDAPEELKVTEKLTFHRINDQKFLELMRKCKAYSSTAGFESICEAMYLGKPIMMVPTYGHFEQACNAIDASNAGAGIPADVFNLSLLVDYIPRHKDVSKEFKSWADSAKEKFLYHLTT